MAGVGARPMTTCFQCWPIVATQCCVSNSAATAARWACRFKSGDRRKTQKTGLDRSRHCRRFSSACTRQASASKIAIRGAASICGGRQSSFEQRGSYANPRRHCWLVRQAAARRSGIDAIRLGQAANMPTVCVTILLRHAANFGHFSDLPKFLSGCTLSLECGADRIAMSRGSARGFSPRRGLATAAGF